jgi:hypothetical protein
VRRVVLHIDRLLLHGFERRDVGPLVAGLRAELTSLLGAENPAEAARYHASSFLQAGTVRVPHGRRPEAVGRDVAGRILHGGRK